MDGPLRLLEGGRGTCCDGRGGESGGDRSRARACSCSRPLAIGHSGRKPFGRQTGRAVIVADPGAVMADPGLEEGRTNLGLAADLGRAVPGRPLPMRCGVPGPLPASVKALSEAFCDSSVAVRAAVERSSRSHACISEKLNVKFPDVSSSSKSSCTTSRLPVKPSCFSASANSFSLI